MRHELKIRESYFAAVKDGTKTFEIRENDRGFQKGDEVVLREISDIDNTYTGNSIEVRITYVTNYNQKENWVALGFKVIGVN